MYRIRLLLLLDGSFEMLLLCHVITLYPFRYIFLHLLISFFLCNHKPLKAVYVFRADLILILAYIKPNNNYNDYEHKYSPSFFVTSAYVLGNFKIKMDIPKQLKKTFIIHAKGWLTLCRMIAPSVIYLNIR